MDFVIQYTIKTEKEDSVITKKLSDGSILLLFEEYVDTIIKSVYPSFETLGRTNVFTDIDYTSADAMITHFSENIVTGSFYIIPFITSLLKSIELWPSSLVSSATNATICGNINKRFKVCYKKPKLETTLVIRQKSILG